MEAAVRHIFLVIFLLTSVRSYAQSFYAEVSAARQWVEGTHSTFQSESILYPIVSVGYEVASRHSIGLTFSALSAHAFVARMEGNESGIDLYHRSYPVGPEYRYQILGAALVHPYLKGALLVIPIRDGVEADTPADYQHTTSWGGHLGFGVDWELVSRWKVVASVDYRMMNNSDQRPLYHLTVDGVYFQLGLHARF